MDPIWLTLAIFALTLIASIALAVVLKKVKRGSVGQAIYERGQLPLQIFIWVVGLSFAAELWGEWPVAMSAVRYAAFIIALLWVVPRVTGRYAELNPGLPQVESIGKVITLIAVAIGALALCGLFGVSLKGLLTIGGLGSLAIGLAGQQVFSNFFSGMVLHFTRPFQRGESIKAKNGIEGEVDSIGWYMTRLISPEGKAVFVPNSTFASTTIVNVSRGKRG